LEALLGFFTSDAGEEVVFICCDALCNGDGAGKSVKVEGTRNLGVEVLSNPISASSRSRLQTVRGETPDMEEIQACVVVKVSLLLLLAISVSTT
jgi:hypothetical protein